MKNVKRLIGALLVLTAIALVPACTGGDLNAQAISLSVVTSRTACAAPCAVYFDATGTTGLTGGDYVMSSFRWDFDSTGTHPGEPHQTTRGFLSTHTYETPGTYTVAVSVKDPSGATASTTTAITVSAMSGTTYYVSSSGSGTTCTIAAPCSLTTGLTHLGPNNSVLLRRGNTFLITSTLNLGNLTGPTIFGAYTDPGAPSVNNPIISSNVTYASSNYIHLEDNSTDLRIVDVHFFSSAHAALGGSVIGTTNQLFLRVEQDQIGSNGNNGDNFLVEDISSYTYFTDCHIHDFWGLGVYGDRTKHFSFVGSTADVYSGADHGIRLQGGNDQLAGNTRWTYIAESTISPTPGGGAFDSMTLRGDNSDSVLVQNTYTATVSASPQNGSRVEHITNVLFDGNYSDLLPQQLGGQTLTGFDIRAQNVVARDNVILNTTATFNVEGPTVLPISYVTAIYLYNTTALNSASSLPGGFHSAFITRAGTTGTMASQNSIVYLATTSTSSVFLETDGQGTVTSTNNLFYSSAATITTPNNGTSGSRLDPKFVSTTTSTPGWFQLQSSSPAIGAGVVVPAPYDYYGTARGATYDMGAVQYVASGSTNSPRNTLFFGAGFCLLAAVGLSLAVSHVREERKHKRKHETALLEAGTVGALATIDAVEEVLSHPCSDCGKPLYAVKARKL